MLIVVSPAKTLDYETPLPISKTSQPVFQKRSAELIDILRGYTPKTLGKLMSISDKLSELNVNRYEAWEPKATKKNARQALFAFKGDVYQGIDAYKLKEAEILFAQDHLWMLSGLYGVLRPLDLMQPYRLEMGTKMQVEEHNNLYQYWGDKITDLINERADKYIINLASNEYFKSVNKKKLNGELIEVSFKENKNGKYKIVAFYAKKARGLMCQYVVKNKLTTPEQMKSFDWDDYTFNEELSSANAYVFTR